VKFFAKRRPQMLLDSVSWQY